MASWVCGLADTGYVTNSYLINLGPCPMSQVDDLVPDKVCPTYAQAAEQLTQNSEQHSSRLCENMNNNAMQMLLNRNKL